MLKIDEPFCLFATVIKMGFWFYFGALKTEAQDLITLGAGGKDVRVITSKTMTFITMMFFSL